MSKNITTGKDGKLYFGKGTKGGKAPQPTLNSAKNINEIAIKSRKKEQPVLDSFYVSSSDVEFLVPADIAGKLSKGDIVYFHDEHILFTDNYGDNNAAYYPYFPKKESDLINLNSDNDGNTSENIESAKTFKDLSDEVKDYFKFGGCAALAQSIHEQLPGSSINAVMSMFQDDPSDATAAHIYVEKDGIIYDAYGATRIENYDFVSAAGTDAEYCDVLCFETDLGSVSDMISHGCFGHEFTEDSKNLIDKVARLTINQSA